MQVVNSAAAKKYAIGPGGDKKASSSRGGGRYAYTMKRRLTRREKATVDERVRARLETFQSTYESKESLATDLGVHPSMVTRYMQGTSGMSEHGWLRLAEIMGITFEELTGLPREPVDTEDPVPERRVAVQAARMVGYSEAAIAVALSRPAIHRGAKRTAAQWLELIAAEDQHGPE